MKRSDFIHIVCLDVPYPVDYGGVFDLFYKLLYLKEQGIKIILHCFQGGRDKQPILENYCEQVYYYKRKRGIRSFSLTVPYIVQSRTDIQLLKNLSHDNFPVLIEGTHCTKVLSQNRLQNRRVVLRLHNIESDYYQQLFKRESSPLRKLYYFYESRLLKKYEPGVFKKADLILPVSEKDKLALREVMHTEQVKMLPVFTGWNKVSIKEGTGNYCLYHGNLEVAENEAVALWLMEYIFLDLEIPLIIAGKNPSSKLISAISKHHHIKIIGNPDETQMEDLIQNAQINLLPSFSTTGIKLKLLHAVFCGRHCITNEAMVTGTHLEKICILNEKADAFKESIRSIFYRPVSSEEMIRRQEVLDQCYNNHQNAIQLIRYLGDEKG